MKPARSIIAGTYPLINNNTFVARWPRVVVFAPKGFPRDLHDVVYNSINIRRCKLAGTRVLLTNDLPFKCVRNCVGAVFRRGRLSGHRRHPPYNTYMQYYTECSKWRPSSNDLDSVGLAGQVEPAERESLYIVIRPLPITLLKNWWNEYRSVLTISIPLRPLL